MKRYLLMILAVILIAGCTSRSTSVPLEVTGIVEKNYEELLALCEDDVNFVLYIARPDCGDCIGFQPVLDDYLSTHKEAGVIYLNIKSFRDASKEKDATQEEIDFYENLRTRFDFKWTPTLEVIDHGKVKAKYQYLDEDYYEIEDREVQLARRQEFIDDFITFMDNYYK
ncbi:MAG: thioredoxin [Erysipelotrichaceae bacterium]|nr:thioredoxin [Erysipelotrichaceae bacterium]